VGTIPAIPGKSRTHALVGTGPAMRAVFERIDTVGPRDSTVLVLGESGTGKERVARAIHDAGPRRGRPFVPVDCTALGDALFESQMFGHERGAFTGAHRDTLGFVRAAQGGTLFIDELGELSPANQAKLLRFLQESCITPVGSVRPVPVEVRVVCATHRDLQAMIKDEAFRLDLYYRVNVVQLTLPPLRERREDIAPIAEDFLARLCRMYGEPGRSLSDEALRVLRGAAWRGNVRELVNAVEHAFVMSGDREIGAEALPATVIRQAADRRTPEDATSQVARPDEPAVSTLDAAQRRLIADALRKTQGHQGRAAELIEVERRRFYRMVKRYNLEAHTRG